MTLSTDVYILDPVDHLAVFKFCQGLLTKYDDPRHLPPEQHQIHNKQDETWNPDIREFEILPGNPWSLDNKPSQGLPAWLMSSYRPNGPLRTAEQAAEHESYCNRPENESYDPDEELCDGSDHRNRACWMSLDFDTPYGYQDSRGWSCGNLHAAMVTELGAWLQLQDVRWEWRNEYTGEVHQGFDGLEALDEQSAEARNWFRSTVMPAIMLDVATRGGGQLEIGGHAVEVPDLSGQTQ